MAELSNQANMPSAEAPDSALRQVVTRLRERWSAETHDGALIHVLCDSVDLLLAAQERFDSPLTAEFLEATKAEAAHQVGRCGVQHDAGKEPEDFFWLIGRLAGKATAAARLGDREKALHHTISSAAVLLNWHAQLSGKDNSFRPGIAAPAEVSGG